MLSKKALEEIDEIIEEIKDLSRKGAAIIVEGKKDKKALRELGVEGPIYGISSNRRTALNFLENLPDYDQIIVLTDFDRTGDELSIFSEKHLRKLGIEPNLELRKKLKLYLRKSIKDIESLEKFLRSEKFLNAKGSPIADQNSLDH